MRVLLVHNFYREPGGEDYAFHAEATVLRRGGHDVETFERSSSEATETMAGVVRTAMGTPWATDAVTALRRTVSHFRPEVVHFHNTFPLISPAAYYAASRAGVPVVQTLHNYRLLCARADLFRNGDVCEECVGRWFPSAAIRHRCYRDSLPGTIAVAGMLALHKSLGTWNTTVNRYVALTAFARLKFIAGGVPAAKIEIKPNFLIDPPPPKRGLGEHVLFLGRLSEEKGIRSLMRAWERIDFPLHIVGGGPLEAEVRDWAASRRNVLVTGRISREAVRNELAQTRLLVFPSRWYEGFPIAILEAMASGVPVLASRIGSLAEIVREGHGGTTFPAGDVDRLAGEVLRLTANPNRLVEMGTCARRAFDATYSEQAGYEHLLRLYEGLGAGRTD